MATPTLYVCCPSYALRNPVEKRDHLKRAAAFARRMGLRVVASPLLDRHLGPGAWLDIGPRRDDLLEALRHDCIWTARGGYGAIHLAPALMEAKVRHRPRLIGYSDITILHACWRVRGWGEAYYGMIPDQLDAGRAPDSLLPLFRGRGLRRDNSTDAAVVVVRPGRAEGTCFAACLAVLAGLAGTPYRPDLRGCLLAVEDIDEKPYQVDFALSQLHAAGALDGVGALIGGSFTHQAALDYGGPGIDDVFRRWGDILGVPVISRLPFGHLPDSLALANGRPLKLVAEADGAWSLEFAPRAARA